MVLLCACSHNASDSLNEELSGGMVVPKHFPQPIFPKSNPYSREKALLGRYLFYEPLLVKDTSFPSCSHCLKQEFAFNNNVDFSKGYGGISENRNTMTLANVVYRNMIFWDGRGNSVDGPAYRSIFMKNIFASDTNDIVKRLEATELYPRLFKQAFGPDTKISTYLAGQAIATFVRTLISGNSKYDKYLNGDTALFSAEEKCGMELFFSERCRCSVCHSGIFFTDMLPHNTGVTVHYFDQGRWYVTNRREDRNRFITPTLRNIEVTAPYMSDGFLPTLDSVIEHYNRGGMKFLMKDTLMRPLNLSVYEKKSLIAFLKTLTDREFLTNKKFSDPHKK